MAKVGYARVSSVGQSLDVQLSKLKAVGCERIYREKLSGTSTQRPEFKSCMEYLREGDCLVITRLDRLARSVLDLARILARFNSEGIDLYVIDQNIDTSTSSGKLLFNMLAAVAEFENELRRERQQEGIAKAKERKVKFGRRPKLSAKKIAALIDDKMNGIPMAELERLYGVSQATIYRHWAAHNASRKENADNTPKEDARLEA